MKEINQNPIEGKIKVGVEEKLDFKKFRWVIVGVKTVLPCNEVYYKYRVYRKYFKNLIPLSNTKCSYELSKSRWDYLKKKLKSNRNFLPQQELWSGNTK